MSSELLSSPEQTEVVTASPPSSTSGEDPGAERRHPLGDLGPLRSGRQPSRRRYLWVLVVVIVAAGLVALRVGWLAAKPVPVEVEAVTRGVVEETVTNTRAGTVEARRRARLATEINGRVAEIPHREGALVEAGDLLLRLDASMQEARLELASQEVRTAAARTEESCLAAELAELELARSTALHTSGIASEGTLDTLTNERDRALAGCRAASSAHDQARAQARVVRIELEHTELRAPFGGVVAEVTTEVGELIASAFMVAPVLDLLDPSSIYVTAPIDEMDAERVEVGQEVRLTVDSRRGESFSGRLARVAPYVLDVVEQNRTIEIEAELDDPEVAASLLPGTSADIEVIIERRDGVLQIPTGAIGPGNKVLLVVEDRLEERAVEVGLANWRTTEVLSGLAEGDLVVVTRDRKEIEAGARVEIREPS